MVTDAPWVINQEFLDKHKIDYVTHDALPYSDASGQAADVYDFVSPTQLACPQFIYKDVCNMIQQQTCCQDC